MKTSKAQQRAQRKYDAKNIRRFGFKLNRTYDADIIEKLESVDSMQGYVKKLIRADIKKGSRK